MIPGAARFLASRQAKRILAVRVGGHLPLLVDRRAGGVDSLPEGDDRRLMLLAPTMNGNCHGPSATVGFACTPAAVTAGAKNCRFELAPGLPRCSCPSSIATDGFLQDYYWCIQTRLLKPSVYRSSSPGRSRRAVAAVSGTRPGTVIFLALLYNGTNSVVVPLDFSLPRSLAYFIDPGVLYFSR